MPRLSEFTTIKLGGEPQSFIELTNKDPLVQETLKLWSTGENWLLLGGGSNLVIADDASSLSVIKIATKGIEIEQLDGKQRWKIQAGENWDEVVQKSVEAGLAGIEALSGIPGSVGAAPVQNIGAYGQELSDVFVACEFLDYETGELVILSPRDIQFGYRDSAIKRGRLGLITWVELELLELDGLARPLYSSQIAAALGLQMGDQPTVQSVRESVLALRASKGMLLSASDPDSVSCGSFFTNPIVSDAFARTLPSDAPKWESAEDDGLTVKLSAAWLIEQAGISKGFSLPGSKAAISSKHALAIVNRGGATSSEVAELARFIQERVAAQFGINLVPEPNLVGF